MRFRAALLGLLSILVLCAGAGQGLHFAWAVISKASDGRMAPIDYGSRTVRLQTGDRLKLHFQARSRCHLYVYLLDSEQNFYLLRQDRFGFPRSRKVAPACTLPEGDDWYRLEGSGGVEVFYLVVSEHRLRRLEALTGRSGPQEDGGGRMPLLRNTPELLGELQRLIRQSGHLAEAPQKPVTMAGSIRGVTEHSDLQGVEVETGSLYVRTIHLEH